MSLKEAVLEIASDLEEMAKNYLDGDVDDPELDVALRLLAAQLRGACRVSPGESARPDPIKIAQYNEELKKQAERKRQQDHEHAQMMEKTGTSMLWCEGGPAHGTLLPAPSAIPIGATPIIMGAVYVMMGDGKLWFNEEETKKMRESLQKNAALIEEGKLPIKD